ncbi:MAG: hypothetical protein FJX76_27595, partial [Armatimonadetes bacterium]|nr:hypothetical protein [Armatimonadota bacterium]
MNALGSALFRPTFNGPGPQPAPAPTAPSGTQPPEEAPPPPATGGGPPPLQPGEVAGPDRPSNPKAGNITFLPPMTTTITRSFERPVLRPENLGRIPSDYYQPAFGMWPIFGSS